MTSENASRANGEGMSRNDMQCEAVAIETLLDAAKLFGLCRGASITRTKCKN